MRGGEYWRGADDVVRHPEANVDTKGNSNRRWLRLYALPTKFVATWRDTAVAVACTTTPTHPRASPPSPSTHLHRQRQRRHRHCHRRDVGTPCVNPPSTVAAVSVTNSPRDRSLRSFVKREKSDRVRRRSGVTEGERARVRLPCVCVCMGRRGREE